MLHRLRERSEGVTTGIFLSQHMSRLGLPTLASTLARVQQKERTLATAGPVLRANGATAAVRTNFSRIGVTVTADKDGTRYQKDQCPGGFM
jgi:hypothetical protein